VKVAVFVFQRVAGAMAREAMFVMIGVIAKRWILRSDP
jgi:hypothetical protein